MDAAPRGGGGAAEEGQARRPIRLRAASGPTQGCPKSGTYLPAPERSECNTEGVPQKQDRRPRSRAALGPAKECPKSGTSLPSPERERNVERDKSQAEDNRARCNAATNE